ncbi:MAG: hypothetical protein JXN62_05830 [Bacteroidales bacterium]|nr:hypothetical protein [Bacteroidales bacterium]
MNGRRGDWETGDGRRETGDGRSKRSEDSVKRNKERSDAIPRFARRS